MAKGVLGNDPFVRGAAVRGPASGHKTAKRTGPSAPPAPTQDVVVQPPQEAPLEPLPQTRRPLVDTAETHRYAAATVTTFSPPTVLQTRALVARDVTRESPAKRLTQMATGAIRAAQTALGLSGAVNLDPYGKDAQLTEALGPMADFLYERYWRVEVVGASKIPAGAAVLVANHSGALPLDGPVLKRALQRERPDLNDARWLVEDQVFHAPFLGVLLNRLGAVRACPENALRLLSEQRPLIVFPEGMQGLQKPFRERYQLKRFGRGGFVKIALRAGVPIVPVSVVGAEETYPLLAKLPGGLFGLPYLPVTPFGLLPLPSKWVIRFGDPIQTEGAEPSDFTHVAQLADRTRDAIQALLQDSLRGRRGVFA